MKSQFPWTTEGEGENIKVVVEDDGGYHMPAYLWVIDTTPETNVTRILFRQEASRACAILYSPHASEIELRLVDHALPETANSMDTPPPGFPITKVTYRLEKASRTFNPEACQTLDTLSARPRSVDCRALLLGISAP
ncbi:hypothetical protein [Xanthomonas maliensis]|uniref:hypothetical protein n=1 Tax=Xanthomonas maliensis TaxID=1321368 RepID=UPI00126584B6|nr:hypothetical protein [Xanthomonas maliensis]